MALPDVTLTIRDPGLGLVPPSAGRVQVKLGVCSRAAPGVLLSFGSVAAAKEALGSGPLLDATVQALDVGGGPILAFPVGLPADGAGLGAVPAFTQAGTGTGTVTGSRAPEAALKVKVITGGALGTATFQTAIGTDAWSPTVVTTGWVGPRHYTVPGAYFSDLVFGAGTYVAGDVYTIQPDGSGVTRVGTGTATLLDGSAHSPLDSYDLKVRIETAGALGVAAFKYSLDGGRSYSSQIGIPAAPGRYTIAGTGIVLTFAGTFVAGDIYSSSVTGAGYTTAELNTALTALMLDPTEWGFLHIIGQAADATGARAIANVVDPHVATAETNFRYVHAIIECPQAGGDADIKTQFTGFVSPRVGVCVGDVYLTSRLTGRAERRSCAWALTARLGAIKLSKNPAAVNLGPLKNVRGLLRDESATQALDVARFITVRTFIGKAGQVFITRYRLMASPGSDFTYGMNRRVMDRACSLARTLYLEYVGDDVRIDTTTGCIDERDAQAIDTKVQTSMETDLVNDGEVSAVSAAVSRSDNLLATSTLHAEVAIVPKGYLDAIAVTIGFQNPTFGA